jgi:ATP-dependent protease HslVU (ClpYQ) peptidase subunit
VSIIVAVKKSNRIALAADSQSNFGSHKFPPDNHKAEKIREIGGSLVAFSGWGLYENILDDYLAGKKTARLDDKTAIFTFFRAFWKQLREKYSFVNDQCKDANDSPFGDLDSSFLIVNRNGIFDVSSNMTISHFEKYNAIGSGAEFALGALHALYDGEMDAAALARSGVETGMAFSVYCGGEITVREVSVDKRKKG